MASCSGIGAVRRSCEVRFVGPRDDELRRYVRSAKLFSDEAIRHSVQYPELLDVRIISMSPQAFTLAGFERIEGAEYAQSWLIVSIPVSTAG